ncbi:hypothetical protein ACWC2H_41845 [Streptomyces sp. 900105755]
MSVLLVDMMDDDWLRVLRHDAQRTADVPVPLVVMADQSSPGRDGAPGFSVSLEPGGTPSFRPKPADSVVAEPHMDTSPCPRLRTGRLAEGTEPLTCAAVIFGAEDAGGAGEA